MLNRALVAFIKIALIVGLFAFLINRALQGSAFSELDFHSLNVSFLFLGFLFNLTATTITIVRWRFLVVALDAPLSFLDALRFGFIGFMFNLSPIGIVGGDAAKVVLLAKKTEIPAERAAASVVVDRVLGLYAMFILGLIVVAATGFGSRTESVALLATRGLTILTIALTFLLALVVAPGGDDDWRRKIASKIPFVGKILDKLTVAMLIYRQRKRVLIGAFLATFFVHGFFAVSLYCFARGLYGAVPNLVDHFILYCVGNVGSTIPLSSGPFEYFLDELYPLFPITERVCFEKGYGMTIGLAYRLGTVAVALLGACFYLFSRQSVRVALQHNADDATNAPSESCSFKYARRP